MVLLMQCVVVYLEVSKKKYLKRKVTMKFRNFDKKDVPIFKAYPVKQLTYGSYLLKSDTSFWHRFLLKKNKTLPTPSPL